MMINKKSARVVLASVERTLGIGFMTDKKVSRTKYTNWLDTSMWTLRWTPKL